MEYSIFSSNLVMFSCTVSYHLSNNGKIFSFFFFLSSHSKSCPVLERPMYVLSHLKWEESQSDVY